MTPGQALAYVRRHGVVLESAHGAAPSLAEEIAGGRIRGSWWSHAKGREIFSLTRAMRGSDDVLVCRLVDGKITYVHRRLWPALVRASSRLRHDRVSQVSEVHTTTGDHLTLEIPVPDWAPSSVRAAARRLSLEEALAKLGPWIH